MKENIVVLSLEELDRLRDIEKNHKIMLEGGIRIEKLNKEGINDYKEIISSLEKVLQIL